MWRMGRKFGTVLSVISMTVEVFSAMFLTPFLIRSLGQAEYGVYSLVLSLVTYLALLDMGVGNSVVRFVSKYKVNEDEIGQRKFLGIITVYYAVIFVVILLIGVVFIEVFPVAFAQGLSSDEIVLAQKLLSITVLSIAITIGTSGFYHTTIAYEKFFVSKGVTIIVSVFRIILEFILLLNGARSIEIVLVNLVCTIVIRGTSVLYVLFRLKIIPTLKNVNFSQIKEIISFSVFIMLQMVATQINNVADQMLIGAFVQASSVILAVYAVGSHICQYVQKFGDAINSVVMPGVVAMVERGAKSKDLQQEMVRIGRLNFMFVALIWCVFLAFGQDFVILWAGEANAQAYWVALILTLPHVIIITENIGVKILWAKEKHKIQAVLKISVVLMNLVLTVILIKWNALLGATIGTFISLMLGDIVVLQVVFKKDIGISITGYYSGLLKGIFPSLVLATAIGLLFKLVGLSGWFGFAVNCAVMTVSYGIFMLMFGLNKYEKNLIFGTVGKVFKKIKTK